jgi:hypothetical protein
MEPFDTFLKNLPAAATSPYAFVAYLGVVAAWTYITVSQRRLKAIESLPPAQRAARLKDEYKVLPRSGLSAEQWIRSRRHTLLFWGFVIVMVAVVTLGTVAMVITPGESRASEPVAEMPRSMGKLEVMVVAPDGGPPRFTGNITIYANDLPAGRRFFAEALNSNSGKFDLPYGNYTTRVAILDKVKEIPVTVATPNISIKVTMP